MGISASDSPIGLQSGGSGTRGSLPPEAENPVERTPGRWLVCEGQGRGEEENTGGSEHGLGGDRVP